MLLPRGRSASAWSLVGLTVLGAGLRFFHLTHQSLWVDEAFSIKYARIFGEMSALQFIDDLHGPLHSLLLHLWSRLFGTGEFALRSMEAVISTLTIPAFAWSLVPLQRKRTLWIATALLAINPFHVWYAQEVRNYALFMFTGVVASGLFLRISLGETRLGPAARFAGYGVVNFLAMLSNLAHFFTMVVHGAVQLFRGRGDRGLWRGFALSWILTLILLGPWIVRFWERHVEVSGALEPAVVPSGEKLRGETSAPLEGIPYTYYVFSVGYSYGPSLRELHILSREMDLAVLKPHLAPIAYAALAFGIVACLGAARLFRQGFRGRYFLVLAILPLLLTYGVSLRNLKVFNPRYASAAMPAYLVVLAEGLNGNRRRSIALGSAILVPTAVSFAQLAFNPAYAKEDARSATEYLQAHARAGDLIFVIGTDEPIERYYWRGIRQHPDGITKGDVGYWEGKTEEEKRRLFEELVAGHHQVYVLLLRDDFVDPEGRWREYLLEAHPPSERIEYPGAEVWIFAGGAQ